MRVAFVSLLIACSHLPLAVADSLSGMALFEDVNTYAAFGHHRTGSDNDLRTSAWLAEELGKAGFTVERQSFKLQQFALDKAAVIAGDTEIKAFPHWFPPQGSTIIEGKVAPLSNEDLSASIAWVAPESAGDWHRVDVSQLVVEAHSKGAVGLVVAISHPSESIYVRNAAEPFLQRSLPIPALVIASRDAQTMVKASEAASTVALYLSGRKEGHAQAENVIARLDRGGNWVVVSTPSSGWFSAAGERGPGIAMFLAMARWLAQNTEDGSYLFVANSGHELSYMGAHHSLSFLPPPEQVDLWIHLGASFATRQWAKGESGWKSLNEPETSIRMFAVRDWMETAKAVFGNIPALDVLPADILPPGRGELVEYIEAGYPAIGLVGAHRFFHTPMDTPAVTSPALLSPYGEAFRQLLEILNDGYTDRENQSLARHESKSMK